ncbi:tetratricopeptide repeat protein [Phaeospirillum tilakii]|uniref:protein O-GlcNAc transferase n=1 Tax=Phaeospirillum tilakii TaxID=741673 RepID=A0ABW5CBG9_9PROT
MIDPEREMARAVALAQAGKVKPALAALEKVVAALPQAIPPRYNLALMLLTAGQPAPALRHLDRILAAAPGHPAASFSKARGLMLLDRAEEAVALLQPLAGRGDPEALLALGNALRGLDRAAEAAEAYRALIRVAPAHPGGPVNLGQLLLGGDAEAAAEVLTAGIARHPRRADLHALLGQALLRLGRQAEAVERLRAALALDPGLVQARGHLLRACRESADWDGEAAVLAELRRDLAQARPGVLVLPVQEALFFPFSGAEMRRIAAAEAAFRVPALPRPLTDRSRPAPPPGAPLTVAYLSPDIREHATMHLAGDLFRAHDRARVRVVVASVGPDDGSGWRERIAADSDAFLDLRGIGDRAAAERLVAAGIDLLVDLSVFTRHARPGIAAHRPAPLQLAWLGLAASPAAPWIDYTIVDPVLVPPGQRDHFAEALIRLPHGYQINQAWAPPVPPPPRAALGLPDDALVLGSFNGHRKLDRASFALWLEILAALPGAVLWQLAPPAPARARLETVAEAAGIARDRLIWAPRLPRAEHLARLPAADLFLDALVCGAHTTAADALRTGVPLVTCAGPRLASRVAASLLSAVGLPELVADGPDGLRDLAIALGRDPARRAELRARLLALLPGAVPFDPARFARDLERAYAEIWQRHRAGKAPADLDL